MNDTYSELLIKKEVTAKDKMIKVLLIALIALMAVAGILITPLAFIAAIALGIAAYFVFPNLDLEFEYVYVNGELDIDKIMAKMKRKRAKTLVFALFYPNIRRAHCLTRQHLTPG